MWVSVLFLYFIGADMIAKNIAPLMGLYCLLNRPHNIYNNKLSVNDSSFSFKVYSTFNLFHRVKGAFFIPYFFPIKPSTLLLAPLHVINDTIIVINDTSHVCNDTINGIKDISYVYKDTLYVLKDAFYVINECVYESKDKAPLKDNNGRV